MSTENEPIAAEKMRKKKFVAITWDLPLLPTACYRSTRIRSLRRWEFRHALCIFDTAFAKHMRELGPERGK